MSKGAKNGASQSFESKQPEELKLTSVHSRQEMQILSRATIMVFVYFYSEINLCGEKINIYVYKMWVALFVPQTFGKNNTNTFFSFFTPHCLLHSKSLD